MRLRVSTRLETIIQIITTRDAMLHCAMQNKKFQTRASALAWSIVKSRDATRESGPGYKLRVRS